jgi:hypothetical protein
MNYPAAIKQNVNVSTPATTADFLPTIMNLLQVGVRLSERVSE